jgi:microcystin degradation protein MlrC
MVRHATLLDCFRTYPHIDMGETGGRAAGLLHRLLVSGDKIFPAFHQLDFLIALNRGCSLIEPCQSIYRELPGNIHGDVIAASFACGFHLSDIVEVGPAVLAYALNQDAAQSAALRIVDSITSRRAVFHQKIWPAAEAVDQAHKLLSEGAETVVLADTQDNPGGGGSGDTTGLLQAMIDGGLTSAVFGIMSDPDIVIQAREAGIGQQFDAMLGGKSGLSGQAPFACRCKVITLADGNFTATGPMYKGAHMSLGPCALIETGGVRVAVSSKPVQTADQSMFRHFGIEPADTAIIALKSSVHFRNDFTNIASEILVVSAPGAVFADPSTLTYQNKRPNLAFR